MTKQIIRIGIAVLTSLLALVVLWQFRVIIAYILISVVLAAALRPLSNRLAGRKLIVRIAWIMLYVLVLGGFLVIVFLTGKAAIAEVQDFGAGLSKQNAWTLPFWLEGTTFQQTLVSWLPPPSSCIYCDRRRTRTACAANHSWFLEGVWWSIGCYAHHILFEHLLECKSNPF